MTYRALYNKYRPSTFEEVAGQQSIVRTLKNAILTNKIAHAYLFCGPRGTGKTSMARLFAKALNCEEGLGHQCNHCSNCVELMNNSHPDVIEIDAASNSGVEQARELVDQVHYSPIKGRYKIYIIDEVHMMSASAFNALLKTIEEPPEKVIFILATTEPHKVLPTIMSRCQRYDFSKIGERDLEAKLKWVLEQEKVTYEEGALKQIIGLADGGMRDALSILDQIIAYSGSHLVEKDVLSVFGLVSTYEKVNLLRAVSSGNIVEALHKLEMFLNGGADITRLCLNLLDILKDLLVYARTRQDGLLDHIKKNDADMLLESITPKTASRMIDILLKAQADFKTVSNLRSLFELTLIRLCEVFDGQENPQIPAKPLQTVPVEAPKPVEKKVEPAPTPVQVEEPKPEVKVEVPPVQKPQLEAGYYDANSNEPYNGTVVPSFLFEQDAPLEKPAPAHETPSPKPAPEIKPEPKPVPKPVPKPSPVEPPAEPVIPLDTSNIKHTKLAIEGTPIYLDDDTILNIMVLGPKFKVQRQQMFREWDRIDALRLDKKYGELASLLADARPFCLCEEALLINFNFTHLKEKANLVENQAGLSELIESMIGRKVFVYALDRLDSNRCQTKYINLKQAGKLPNPDNVVLQLPKGGK